MKLLVLMLLISSAYSFADTIQVAKYEGSSNGEACEFHIEKYDDYNIYHVIFPNRYEDGIKVYSGDYILFTPSLPNEVADGSYSIPNSYDTCEYDTKKKGRKISVRDYGLAGSSSAYTQINLVYADSSLSTLKSVSTKKAFGPYYSRGPTCRALKSIYKAQRTCKNLKQIY
jgi:hypothetical protein